MENASKALLMAGGMLLVILLVSLFIYAWGIFSDYYSSQQDLSEISDTTKFNLQFTNYDRDDIRGYELISLLNRVIDYNQRFSTTGTNDENYNPIEIVIYMWGYDNNVTRNTVIQKLSYSGENLELFTQPKYIQNDTNNSFGSALRNISNLETNYGKENLEHLSKSIGSIFPNTDNWTGEIYTETRIQQEKKSVVDKFNSLTSSRYVENVATSYTHYQYIQNENNSIENRFNRIQNIFKDASYSYYEYTQFKKAIFSSISSTIEYDNASGRISHMEFYFTGDIE